MKNKYPKITLTGKLNDDNQIELDANFAKKLNEVYQSSKAIDVFDFLKELEKTKVIIKIQNKE